MKIRTIGQLQATLDDEFAWRLKEIADVKLAARQHRTLGEKTLIRAGVALLYAHWEGFVKSAAAAYINFVDNQGRCYGELQTCFAVLGIRKHLSELAVTRKSRLQIAALEFIRNCSSAGTQLQTSVVDTESNLKSEVFENIAISIGIGTRQYESRFKLMDESLLRRRNKIAHGEYLDLDADSWRALADEVIALMRDFKTDVENAASTSSYVL